MVITYHTGSAHAAHVDVVVAGSGVVLRSYVSAQQTRKFATFIYAVAPSAGKSTARGMRNLRIGAPCPAPLILRIEPFQLINVNEMSSTFYCDNLLVEVPGARHSSTKLYRRPLDTRSARLLLWREWRLGNIEAAYARIWDEQILRNAPSLRS